MLLCWQATETSHELLLKKWACPAHYFSQLLFTTASSPPPTETSDSLLWSGGVNKTNRPLPEASNFWNLSSRGFKPRFSEWLRKNQLNWHISLKVEVRKLVWGGTWGQKELCSYIHYQDLTLSKKKKLGFDFQIEARLKSKVTEAWAIT